MQSEDPIELNLEDLMKKGKLDIPADSARSVDKKMGSFVYLSCLFPELWSLEC